MCVQASLNQGATDFSRSCAPFPCLPPSTESPALSGSRVPGHLPDTTLKWRQSAAMPGWTLRGARERVKSSPGAPGGIFALRAGRVHSVVRQEEIWKPCAIGDIDTGWGPSTHPWGPKSVSEGRLPLAPTRCPVSEAPADVIAFLWVTWDGHVPPRSLIAISKYVMGSTRSGCDMNDCEETKRLKTVTSAAASSHAAGASAEGPGCVDPATCNSARCLFSSLVQMPAPVSQLLVSIFTVHLLRGIITSV